MLGDGEEKKKKERLDLRRGERNLFDIKNVIRAAALNISFCLLKLREF